MKCECCDHELVGDESYLFKDGTVVFRSHCPNCGAKYESNKPIAKRREGVPEFPVSIGSFWKGFALGLFLSVIGLMIVTNQDEKDTTGGAISGFIINIMVVILGIWLVGKGII